MPHYLWKGMTVEGHPLEGAIESPSSSEVLLSLRTKNIFNITLRRIPNSQIQSPLKDELLLHFLIHLNRLLESGLEFVDSLSFIIRYQNNPSLNYILCTLRQDLEAGKSLTEAFEHFKLCFPHLFIHLLRVAESSDKLKDIVEELLSFYTFQNKHALERRKLYTYPLIVGILSSVLFLGILAFIVPNFKTMFSVLGDDLPLLTKGIIELSDSLLNSPQNWILAALGMVGIYRFGLRRIDWGVCIQFIPGLRKMEEATQLLFYARSMMIMLKSGTQLRESLEISKSLFPKRLWKDIQAVHQQIDSGVLLVDAYRSCRLFPPLFLHLIALGESSGYMVPTFERIAMLYQEKIEKRMALLHSMIEPLFTVMLALGILTVLLSIYLPIFSMAEHF